MHLQRLSLPAQASEASSRTFWCIVSCLVSWSYFFSLLVSPSLVSFLKSETSVSLTSHRISTSSEPACELRPKPTSLPNGLGPQGMLCTQRGLDQGHPFLFRFFQDVISQGFLAECQVLLSRDPTGQEKYALKPTSVKNMVSIFKKASMPFVIWGEAHHMPFANNTFDFPERPTQQVA